MWCHRCRQDVPAIAFGAMKGVGCVRCGAKLTAEGTAVVAAESTTAEADSMGLNVAAGDSRGSFDHSAPQLEFDDWDSEPEWRLLEELVSPLGQSAPRPATSALVPPPVSAGGWNVMHAAHGAAPHAIRPVASPSSEWLSSITIGIGAIGLAAAAASIPVSRISGWEWLGNWCWPLAAAGQVLWVIGFALQLDRIRQANRASTDELEHVKSQLVRLEQTTALLSGPHGHAGPEFYQPPVAGEQPSMLLADVKGQLDQLSRRLAKAGR